VHHEQVLAAVIRYGKDRSRGVARGALEGLQSFPVLYCTFHCTVL